MPVRHTIPLGIVIFLVYDDFHVVLCRSIIIQLYVSICIASLKLHNTRGESVRVNISVFSLIRSIVAHKLSAGRKASQPITPYNTLYFHITP